MGSINDKALAEEIKASRHTIVRRPLARKKKKINVHLMVNEEIQSQVALRTGVKPCTDLHNNTTKLD